MEIPAGSLHHERSEDAATIWLEGECDIALRESASVVLLEFAMDKSVRRLTIDMQNATFIDAAFVGLLIKTRNQHESHRGRDFTLVNPVRAVARVLDLTDVKYHS